MTPKGSRRRGKVKAPSLNERVTLTDQFGTETNVLVTAPQMLCTTVTKTLLSAAASAGSDRSETATAASHASDTTMARGADKTSKDSANRR